MKSSFELVRVRGIQIRVHVTFGLILVWAAYTWGSGTDNPTQGALFGVIATVILFFCVTLHELGHSFQAMAYGIPVKDITLYPIGGVARIGEIPEDPKRELRIAIAGPLVNVVIVVVLVAAAFVLDRTSILSFDAIIDDMEQAQWSGLLPYMILANLSLVIFNLVPAFPMDGGRILRAVLAMRLGLIRATRIAAVIGQVLAIGFGIYGIYSGSFFLIAIAIFVWSGARQEGQAAQLRGALQDAVVGYAMNPTPRTLSPSDPVRRGMELSIDGAQADFPVVNDAGELVGLLTIADLVRALHEQPDAPVGQVMRRAFPVVRANESIVIAQQRLVVTESHSLPVIDAEDRLVGLLTSEAVAESLRRLSSQRAFRVGRKRR